MYFICCVHRQTDTCACMCAQRYPCGREKENLWKSVHFFYNVGLNSGHQFCLASTFTCWPKYEEFSKPGSFMLNDLPHRQPEGCSLHPEPRCGWLLYHTAQFAALPSSVHIAAGSNAPALLPSNTKGFLSLNPSDGSPQPNVPLTAAPIS